MPTFAALLATSTLVAHLVVDQVDGGVAAVEWRGTDITWLPVDLLPAHASEGDRVLLRVRCRPPRRARGARLVRRIERSGLIPQTGLVPEEKEREEGQP